MGVWYPIPIFPNPMIKTWQRQNHRVVPIEFDRFENENSIHQRKKMAKKYRIRESFY
jgi:hypothetical protein